MKHALVILFVGLIIGLGLYQVYRSVRIRFASGTVIVLNGPSAFGKTSIQKEFQQVMMPNLWLKVGIDSLFDGVMPDINSSNMSFWESINPIRWLENWTDKDQHQVIPPRVGEQGQKVAYGMNSAIAAYAHNGCNLIVDYRAYEQAWLKDLESKLRGCKVYYVAVDIPLETIEERERSRGTSPASPACSHYATYADHKYDLRVDTGKSSAHDIAKQLQALVK